MASLKLADPANAENPNRWGVHPSVGFLESVTLRIHWFGSTEELREAARNSGQAVNEFGLHGFSILKRDTETGQHVCDVYAVTVINDLTDGRRTKIFGHEILHCVGLRHQ